MITADVVVIGGGPGGYPAAIRAAQRGADTILIDPGPLGGVCLNEGCIPSKGLLEAGDLLHRASELFGIEIDGNTALAQARKRNVGVIGDLRSGIESLLRASGVRWIAGHGRFVDRDVISVGDDVVRFRRAIIATGSTSTPLPGVTGVPVVDAKGVLDLETVPESVVVVGAGAIGLELACVLSRFGSRVTVVELADRALLGFEPDHAARAVRSLAAEGIRFVFDARLVGDDSGLQIVTGGTVESVEADLVVAAIGRRPTTRGLDLERGGVEVDSGGFVVVDSQCISSNPSVLAIGDVTPGPGLAHRATAQGLLAADVCNESDDEFDPLVIPSIVYCDPQVVAVGHTIESARAAGHDVVPTRFPMSANGRNNVSGGGAGELLIVADERTDVVVGIHAVGHGVETLAAAAVVALEMGAVVDDLARSVFAHPTLGDTLGEAAHFPQGVPVRVPRPRTSVMSGTGSSGVGAATVEYRAWAGGAVVDDGARWVFAHPTLGETLGEAAHFPQGVPVRVPRSRTSVTSGT